MGNGEHTCAVMRDRTCASELWTVRDIWHIFIHFFFLFVKSSKCSCVKINPWHVSFLSVISVSSVISAICPAGWLSFAGNCYWLVSNLNLLTSWYLAQTQCFNMGANLVTIKKWDWNQEGVLFCTVICKMFFVHWSSLFFSLSIVKRSSSSLMRSYLIFIRQSYLICGLALQVSVHTIII